MMTVTANWFRRFGRLVLVGTLCFGGGNAFAANNQDQLQPIPSPSSAPMTQPVAGGQSEGVAVQENATASIDEAEFCGLPLCSPPGRFWLRADYLMWWTSGIRLPPLVTTSSQGTSYDRAGVLGLPSTTILYGNGTVNTDGRSGVRTTIGMWLDCCHVWNLEFDYLTLGQRENSFERASTDTAILARPFFSVETAPGAQTREIVSYPGQSDGMVAVDVKEYFQSVGALVSYNLCSCNSCCDPCDPCDAITDMNCCPPLLHCCRTDLLVGLRYYNLSDSLGVHEALDTRSLNISIDVHDNFAARNDFYGSELGLRTQVYRGRWSFEMLAKVAMGNNHQVVTIDGHTVATSGSSTVTYPHEGVFAVRSNEALDAQGNVVPGVFERDVFTVIPQLGMELGYQVSCHWRAYVGYNLLFWGNVWRASDQIDLNIDPRNIPPVNPQNPGLPFPAFPGRSTSFWAQGVNVGTEFRF